MDEKRIKARASARESAADMFSLINLGAPPWMKAYGADYGEAFVEELQKLFPQRATKTEEPEKLEPIARLGATVLGFGQYAGKNYDKIPLDYLDWLCANQEESCQWIKAYLKHPEIESRRGTE